MLGGIAGGAGAGAGAEDIDDVPGVVIVVVVVTTVVDVEVGGGNTNTDPDVVGEVKSGELYSSGCADLVDNAGGRANAEADSGSFDGRDPFMSRRHDDNDDNDAQLTGPFSVSPPNRLSFV